MTPRRGLLGGLLFLLLEACTPHVVPLGPETADPQLVHRAVLSADGARLPLRAWKPLNREPDAILLALHGFNDYSNFFDDAGGWLAERGIASYAYDQRGFGATRTAGLWSGGAVMAADATVVTRLLRQIYPGRPLYLLGDSMGGAVALVAMAAPVPPDVDGVILVAPAVWGRKTMPWFQRWMLELSAHTLPWLPVSGTDLGIRASDNRDMLHRQWLDPLVIKDTRIDAVYGLVDLMDKALDAAPRLRAPALILYGEKDEIIPREPTRLLLSRLSAEDTARGRIALYEDGYHMLLRDLGAETYWTDLLHWIRNPAAPLPSGADKRT